MATTTAKGADVGALTEQLAALLGVPSDGARVALEVDGATMGGNLHARGFKAGSDGYGLVGKVDGQDGRRYQVSITLTRIGSKAEADAPKRAALVEAIAKAKAAQRVSTTA